MNQDEMLVLYRKMVELRRLDELLLELKMKGLIMDGFHPYQRQEAVALGGGTALRPEDVVISTHRPQGHAFSKGTSSRQIMAEFLGREAGYCHGRGGSMHIADLPGGNMGATGVVGGGIPTAVGIALALQMHHSEQILLSYFGDGATNEGEFHESLNMASTWKLPVVFICDNNQYGMSMHVSKVMNIEHISQRAASYGIPGVTVDGNDVLAVYEAVAAAGERARSGQGPSLVDCLSYRWRGHSKSDRNLYRTPQEIDEWKHKCPIKRFKKILVDATVMTTEETEAIDLAAKTAIDRAAEEALTFPEPSPENMEDEVYAS